MHISIDSSRSSPEARRRSILEKQLQFSAIQFASCKPNSKCWFCILYRESFVVILSRDIRKIHFLPQQNRSITCAELIHTLAPGAGSMTASDAKLYKRCQAFHCRCENIFAMAMAYICSGRNSVRSLHTSHHTIHSQLSIKQMMTKLFIVPDFKDFKMHTLGGESHSTAKINFTCATGRQAGVYRFPRRRDLVMRSSTAQRVIKYLSSKAYRRRDSLWEELDIIWSEKSFPSHFAISAICNYVADCIEAQLATMILLRVTYIYKCISTIYMICMCFRSSKIVFYVLMSTHSVRDPGSHPRLA